MSVLIRDNPGDSTIDISGLSFIDAAGLGCLVDINNRLTAVGARLRLTGTTPKLRRIFVLGGLAGLGEPPPVTDCWSAPTGVAPSTPTRRPRHRPNPDDDQRRSSPTYLTS